MNRRTLYSALIALSCVIALTSRASAQDCGAADYDCKIGVQNGKIRSDPDDAEAYYDRGMAYSHKGDYANALADFNKYLTFSISNKDYAADGYAQRGYTRYKLKDYNAAGADFNEAIRLNPKNKLAYFNRGLMNMSLQKWSLAVKDFDEAIRLDPDEYEVYYNRGLSYRKLGLFDRAVTE